MGKSPAARLCPGISARAPRRRRTKIPGFDEHHLFLITLTQP